MPQSLMPKNWLFLWRPTTSSRINTKKRCPFHHRGLECRSRELRETQSNRQVNNRAKLKRALSREDIGHSKHPFQQPKRQLYTWTSPDGQNQNLIEYVLCSQRNFTQSAKTRLGVDCASDYEFLMAKFKLYFKTVGKPLDHSSMT